MSVSEPFLSYYWPTAFAPNPEEMARKNAITKLLAEQIKYDPFQLLTMFGLVHLKFLQGETKVELGFGKNHELWLRLDSLVQPFSSWYYEQSYKQLDEIYRHIIKPLKWWPPFRKHSSNASVISPEQLACLKTLYETAILGLKDLKTVYKNDKATCELLQRNITTIQDGLDGVAASINLLLRADREYFPSQKFAVSTRATSSISIEDYYIEQIRTRWLINFQPSDTTSQSCLLKLIAEQFSQATDKNTSCKAEKVINEKMQNISQEFQVLTANLRELLERPNQQIPLDQKGQLFIAKT